MLGTVDIVLVTENAAPVSIIPCAVSYSSRYAPDAHARAGDGRQLDRAGETLVTLRIIVLKTDLEFNGLEEIAFLCVGRVFQQLLHVLAHSGC